MVPTDGSPESDRAIPIAEQIAAATGAAIVLVQVVPFPTFTDDLEHMSTEIYQQILDIQTEAAEANVATLAARFEAAGVHASTQVVRGTPAFSLLDIETAE